MQYIGRFAPSPSGPLHFGSLVAALGSYLQAKANNGKWLVRIEDIDPPREMKGATTSILRALEEFSLHWDDSILYQSSRTKAYQEQIDHWLSNNEAYYCQCTRQEIKQAGGIYKAWCKDKKLDSKNASVRLHLNKTFDEFKDLRRGVVKLNTELSKEDFIIKRRDGLFAYNLAVVMDDIYQGVTEIVRGADLLEPTARQLGLYHKLNAKAVSYLHLPLALNADGSKLSKQNHAAAIDAKKASMQMTQALIFLGHTPPDFLHGAPVKELLQWAIGNWQISNLPCTNNLYI